MDNQRAKLGQLCRVLNRQLDTSTGNSSVQTSYSKRIDGIPYTDLVGHSMAVNWPFGFNGPP